MADSDKTYNYDPEQQIYALSMFANAVGTRGPINGGEAKLQSAMEKALSKSLAKLSEHSDWELSWGPKVYTGGRLVAMNVWYVVTSATQKRCVVAIAGTAVKSIATWMKINFAVQQVVDFNVWVDTWKTILDSKGQIEPPKGNTPSDGKPFCSVGTCHAVSNLLNYTPPKTAKSPGTRLHEHLEKIPSGYTFIFTGHSMGAAVAPTLALGLVRSDVAGMKSKDVRVYPSAGASPGNDEFSKLYGLGANAYNPNDIVPMAWGISSPEDQNIDNIMGKIYTGAQGKAKTTLVKVVEQAKSRSRESGVTYMPIQGEKIPTKTVKQPSTRRELRVEVGRQHVAVYIEHWKIEPLIKVFDGFLDKVLGPEEEIEEDDESDKTRTITLVDGTEYELCIPDGAD